MRASKFVIWILLFLNLALLSEGQEVDNLIAAKVAYSKLLIAEAEPGPRLILSSSVLGKSVVDLASILKKDGIIINDSDVVIYGPDTQLLYAKCSPEKLRRIKDLYAISTTSKSAYRLRIDVVDKLDSPDDLAGLRLDTVVVSGESLKVRPSEKTPIEVLFTEGVDSEGASQYEIKIAGLASLAMVEVPRSISCKVQLDRAKALYEFSLEEGLRRIIRIRLDPLVLNNDMKHLISNPTPQREQMLGVIRSEIEQVKK